MKINWPNGSTILAKASKAIIAGTLGTAVAPLAKLALIIGSIYLTDCRFSSHASTRAEIDSCYFQAMTIMGVGGGIQVGYNTLNPSLKRPEDGPGRPG